MAPVITTVLLPGFYLEFIVTIQILQSAPIDKKSRVRYGYPSGETGEVLANDS